MAMKKIKPQYGKVVAPAVNFAEDIGQESKSEEVNQQETKSLGLSEEEAKNATDSFANTETLDRETTAVKHLTSEPNPFLQTKEVFAKARLTKIGYRMRSEYVEILDIIKKVKKGGYTLEAVLDDALTFYFENSEDGQQAIKKAEIFYS